MARAARVLVVEDDPDVRLLVRTLLEAEGYHVATLDRSAAVVAAVEAHAPDVILLDLMMDEVNGLDVLTRLQAAALPCPVIMCSAYLSSPRGEWWVAQARELGAQFFLSKPFALDDLLAAVQQAVAGRGA